MTAARAHAPHLPARLARRRASPGWSRTATVLAGSAAALAAAALYNTLRTRRAEREHPPAGRFLDVDGVRLHYLERGEGPPVVLLHGNVVTAEDWALSGVLDRVAARGHRVIAFDRPGYGHSDRPRGRAWAATDQADLLLRALARLGVERPAVVVGHSWGALAALALALADPAAVRGLVLLSGYYHPTLRADALLVAPAAVPVLGDLLGHTVSPLFGAATLPLLVKGMFAPLPVPERFEEGFPHAMAVRPSQIRAEARDGAGMAPQVRAMRDGYGGLRMPVVIMAGAEDKVVDVGRHAVRLRSRSRAASCGWCRGRGTWSTTRCRTRSPRRSRPSRGGRPSPGRSRAWPRRVAWRRGRVAAGTSTAGRPTLERRARLVELPHATFHPRHGEVDVLLGDDPAVGGLDHRFRLTGRHAGRRGRAARRERVRHGRGRPRIRPVSIPGARSAPGRAGQAQAAAARAPRRPAPSRP
jgi:pimeloyl-ACP methyl ester carboxylesterase